jgi:glucokinase
LPPIGNQSVIAAGTGLGEAGLYWDGKQYHIFASEGGHADFGPRNDLEVELFCYLTKKFGHVSYERILSGPGLINVYDFLRDTKRGTEQKWLLDEMAQEDPAAAISRAGIAGKDPLSEQAVDIFVSVYGAEAGNLALKTKSTGGLYVAGGIAPKMLPKLTEPPFMNAFFEKGRMRGLMESIAVHVITNDKLALLGAARCAVTPVA